MTNYIVCEGHSASLLATAVKSQIVEGYVPIGGLALIKAEGGRYPIFYQAMVKEKHTSTFAEKLRAIKRRGWTLDEAIANGLDEALEEANAEDQD